MTTTEFHSVLLLLLLRKQGPRHTPWMYRSLEAYCATMGPPRFGRSRFCHQVPPPHIYTMHETPSSERRNSVVFTSPPKEGVLRIFSPLKIRRLRPGLNPRTYVLKASTLTPRPPKPPKFLMPEHRERKECMRRL